MPVVQSAARIICRGRVQLNLQKHPEFSSQLLLLSTFACSFYLSKSPSGRIALGTITSHPSIWSAERAPRSPFVPEGLNSSSVAETSAFHRHTAPLLVWVPNSLSLTPRTYSFNFLLSTWWVVVVGEEITLPVCLIPVPGCGDQHLGWGITQGKPAFPPASLACSTWEQQERSWGCLKLPQKIFTKLICAFLAGFDLPC